MADTWPWQPIETAPRDGSDILVCCGPDHDPMYAVVHWDDGKTFGHEPGWLMWWRTPFGYATWAQYWQPIALAPNSANQ